VTLLVACVWLNQSVGRPAAEKIPERLMADPMGHLFELLRYPFTRLYRRSGDEALYYWTAARLLGRPFDNDAPGYTRGRVPAWHESPPPPGDGRLHVPWIDVHLEYPPTLVPFIVAPALITSRFESYVRVLGSLMGLCIVAAVFLATDIIRRTQTTRSSTDSRWWLATALLLALGSLTIQRLDPVVALAMVAALHGAVRRSHRHFALCAAIAGACKIVPLLVVPVIIAADWQTWRARIPSLAKWLVLGLALGFAPMLCAGPRPIVEFFGYHGSRGLQVESTLALVLGAIRYAAGTPQPATLSYGSFNLDGPVADFLAASTVPLTLAVIFALVIRERRAGDPPDEARRVERMASAALGATVALWLCSKVFSPQYLTWGIPLAVAIPGRRGAIAWVLFFGTCVLTQAYFRGFYNAIIEQRLIGLVTLLLRQGVLVVLLVCLITTQARNR
jgi:hypothetical protein